MEQSLYFPRRISLRGVAVGALVAVVASDLVFALAGGLGVWSFKVLDAESVKALGRTEGIWAAVSWIVAVLAGSYIAASIGRAMTRRDGVLHGIATWALACFAFTVLGSLSLYGAMRVGLANPNFIGAVDWRPILLGSFFTDLLALVGAILAGMLAARQEAELPTRAEVVERPVPARPIQTP